MGKKAILLLSGGVDSCVVLAMARQKWLGNECLGISFNYGQKHKIELNSAKKIAQHYKIEHQIINLDPESFKGSSLTSKEKVIAKGRTLKEIVQEGVPSTYVPARNTLFLAYAMCHAEIHSAQEIHFGPNALDQLPYPDCRPNYVKAIQGVLNCATKQAVEGRPPILVTPLIQMNKREIVKLGISLEAPLQLTFSCYDPTHEGKACLSCDACFLREEAFAAQI